MFKTGEKVLCLLDDYKYDYLYGYHVKTQLLKKGKIYTIMDPYDISLEELPNYSFSDEHFMSMSELRKKKLIKLSEC